MNLIVISDMTYDEGLYFRFITMVSKKDLKMDILIESEKKKIDFYYELLKRKGWFDYVDDFITPEDAEEGIRIDKEYNYPKTIKVNKICYENATSILGQIKSLKELDKSF
tara:strand:- start:488 stop:817 length:330 start_codon:yes stop_codon:yes gene_type:complete